MNNLNWETTTPYLINEVDCGALYIVGKGTYSYQITNQDLFNKYKENLSAEKFTRNQVLYALTDIIKEEEKIDADNMDNIFTSTRIMQEANENIEGFGFRFTDIKVNNIDLDNSSTNLYNKCLSTGKIVTEEKVETSKNNQKKEDELPYMVMFGIGFIVLLVVLFLMYRLITGSKNKY